MRQHGKFVLGKISAETLANYTLIVFRTWLQLLRGVRPVNVAIMQTNHAVDPAFAEDLLPEIASLEDMPPPVGYLFMECKHPLLGVVRQSWPKQLAHLHHTLSVNSERLMQSESRDINNAVVLLDAVTQHILSGRMHSVFRTVVTWVRLLNITLSETLPRTIMSVSDCDGFRANFAPAWFRTERFYGHADEVLSNSSRSVRSCK